MRTLFVISLLCFLTAPLSAELYKCGDTWTNKGCDSNAAATLPERETSAEELQFASSFNEKRSILRDFHSFRIALQREQDFYMDTTELDRVCLASESRVKACQEKIESYETRLVTLAELSKKKAIEEQKKTEKEATKQADVNTVVVNNIQDPFITLERFPGGVIHERRRFSRRGFDTRFNFSTRGNGHSFSGGFRNTSSESTSSSSQRRQVQRQAAPRSMTWQGSSRSTSQR